MKATNLVESSGSNTPRQHMEALPRQANVSPSERECVECETSSAKSLRPLKRKAETRDQSQYSRFPCVLYEAAYSAVPYSPPWALASAPFLSSSLTISARPLTGA